MKNMKNLSTLTAALAAVIVLGACSSDDTYTQPQPQVNTEPLPIAFSSYIGRNVTRASIIDATAIQTQGVGVWAMLTTGKYEPTPTATGANTQFSPEFFNNTKVAYETNNSKWNYDGVTYWPKAHDQYVSFLAYGPYMTDATLYNSTGGTDGDKTYLKYDATQTNQFDILRSKFKLANMQCWYDHTDATTSEQTTGQATIKKVADDNDAFATDANNTDVRLTMIHPTARIAVSVSSSALQNYEHYTTTTNGEAIKSNTTITINSIKLLGDQTTAEATAEKPVGTATAPTGAFTHSAYLNLAGKVSGTAGKTGDDGYSIGTGTDKTSFWVADNSATDKLAFSFNSFYSGSFKDDYSADTQNTTVGPGRKMWVPSTNSGNVIEGTAKVEDGKVSGIPTVADIGTGASDYLFIIPQDFSTDGLYCYINYTVKYSDEPDKGYTYAGYGQIKKDFVAGGAYVIRIDINNTNVAARIPITFTVEDENWSDETQVDVKI